MCRRILALAVIALGLLTSPAGAAVPVQDTVNGLQITATLETFQLADLNEFKVTAVFRNESARTIRLGSPNPCTPAHMMFIYFPDGFRFALGPGYSGFCAMVVGVQTWAPGAETRIVFQWQDLPLVRSAPGVYLAEIRGALTPPSEPGLFVRFRVGDFYDTRFHSSWQLAREAAEQGWLFGYPDNTFRPDRLVTRRELTAMLSRSYGVPEGYFLEPERPVTRLEATRDMVRLAGMAQPAAGAPPFSDTSDPAVAAAHALGLLPDHWNGSFGPDQQVTRAEAVAMILKLPRKR